MSKDASKEGAEGTVSNRAIEQANEQSSNRAIEQSREISTLLTIVRADDFADFLAVGGGVEDFKEKGQIGLRVPFSQKVRGRLRGVGVRAHGGTNLIPGSQRRWVHAERRRRRHWVHSQFGRWGVGGQVLQARHEIYEASNSRWHGDRFGGPHDTWSLPFLVRWGLLVGEESDVGEQQRQIHDGDARHHETMDRSIHDRRG